MISEGGFEFEKSYFFFHCVRSEREMYKKNKATDVTAGN